LPSGSPARAVSTSGTFRAAARRAGTSSGSSSIGPGPAATPEDSVSIEDCEQVNREISTILDVEDPLPFAYTLEVSSPGLDRPLRGAEDYRRFAGRLVKVVVSEAVDNQKRSKAGCAGSTRRRPAGSAERAHAPVADAADYEGEARSGILAIRRSQGSMQQNPLMQTIEALAKEKGHRGRHDHHSDRGRRPDRVAQVLQDEREPEDPVQSGTGQVDLFAIKHIVPEVSNPATEISLREAQELYGDEAEVDMEIEFPKRTDVLGRIAAQTAKQVIFQKVREAERENIFAEYNQRIGEVINSTVKRFENGDLIVEIGRVEAVLPRKEQSRAESYTPGERIARSSKASIAARRAADRALPHRPGAADQAVRTGSAGDLRRHGHDSRRGARSRRSCQGRRVFRERDVDPVGACVGMKGTRVQAIIRELRGEKIDIVEWSKTRSCSSPTRSARPRCSACRSSTTRNA
jgi:ribosome maturation factor RimP